MKAISKLPRYYQNEDGLPLYVLKYRISSEYSQMKKRSFSNYL